MIVTLWTVHPRSQLERNAGTRGGRVAAAGSGRAKAGEQGQEADPVSIGVAGSWHQPGEARKRLHQTSWVSDAGRRARAKPSGDSG